MKIKYESLEDTNELDDEGIKIKEWKEKDKDKATHIHKCRHEEGMPCTREKL